MVPSSAHGPIFSKTPSINRLSLSYRRYTSGNQNRLQFASSVDLLPLFVTLGHGDTNWKESDDLLFSASPRLRVNRAPV